MCFASISAGEPRTGSFRRLAAEVPKNTSILIVDDDPGLRELLERYLGEQSFSTGVVTDDDAMECYLAAQPAGLNTLDRILPADDGLTLAKRLRASTDIPAIMLSDQGEDVDRIIDLEVGTDDYLAKPFNPRELLARLRALLRRLPACRLAGRQGEGRFKNSSGNRPAESSRCSYRWS